MGEAGQIPPPDSDSCYRPGEGTLQSRPRAEKSEASHLLLAISAGPSGEENGTREYIFDLFLWRYPSGASAVPLRGLSDLFLQELVLESE